VGLTERDRVKKRKIRSKFHRTDDQFHSHYSPFEGLKQIAEDQNLKEAEKLYKTGQILEAVERFDQVEGLEKKEKYRVVASECYKAFGKISLSERNLLIALKAFKKSNSLKATLESIEKIRLLELAIQAWEKLSSQFSVADFALRLGIVTKDTHLYEPTRYLEYILGCGQISSLLKIKKYHWNIRNRNLEIHILGYYRSRPPNLWATKIREYKIKCDHNMALPLGILMVDYLFWEKSLLSHIDLLVPVAPDPEKFVSRGFGPTDQLAQLIGQYTALPTRMAILRNEKKSFYVDEGTRKDMARKSILLIEDVITSGTTLLNCVDILFDCATSNVSALVLGAASESWFH
jgi:phosphoribosylpyrophosphate synthetase